MIAGMGSNVSDVHALERAASRAAKGGRLADPILRAEIARAAIDSYASEATRMRYHRRSRGRRRTRRALGAAEISTARNSTSAATN